MLGYYGRSELQGSALRATLASGVIMPSSRIWRRLWLAWLLYACGLGVALAWAVWWAPVDWLRGDRTSALNAAVVALTGFVVIWYTWETYQLRIATNHQVSLQLHPYVIARSQGHPIGDKYPENMMTRRVVTLTNVGNGLAVNIRVREARPDPKCEFEGVSGLAGGESAVLRAYEGVAELGGLGAAVVKVQQRRRLYADVWMQPRELVIEFQDLMLRSYSLALVVDGDNVTIRHFRSPDVVQ